MNTPRKRKIKWFRKRKMGKGKAISYKVREVD
jgi:hypothetical protein